MGLIRVAHAPWTFSPHPRVNDPDMNHGTCVTHVQWCMSGSLTSGFLWNRRRGKRSRHSRRMRNTQFYVYGKRSMVCLLLLWLSTGQFYGKNIWRCDIQRTPRGWCYQIARKAQPGVQLGNTSREMFIVKPLNSWCYHFLSRIPNLNMFDGEVQQSSNPHFTQYVTCSLLELCNRGLSCLLTDC